ncbi:MAG: type II secretion system protein, partial [Bacteriovoracaceae bacterium]|nr:type II secretion system protein [Bacteriovoracaceae bacterium]
MEIKRRLSIGKRGFSLVEVMVSLGLLGGIAAIVAMLSNQMNKNQNTMEVKLDAQVFSAGFTAYLMSESACSALVSKTPPSASSNPINLSVQGFAGFGVNPNQTLQAGTVISKNLKMDELTLKTKDGVTPLNTTVNGVLSKKSIVQVKYTLKASNVAKK